MKATPADAQSKPLGLLNPQHDPLRGKLLLLHGKRYAVQNVSWSAGITLATSITLPLTIASALSGRV